MAHYADIFYKEALEHCQTYNSRLMAERRSRLPYLDSQTKVAQNGCALWFEKRHRGPGLRPNQIYSYPSKRWKKRPRFNPISDSTFDSLTVSEVAHLINENSNDSASINAITAAMMEGDSELGDTSSLGGVGGHMDNDDFDYFDDDYETRSRKKSKKGPKGAGKLARKTDVLDDKDKLYTCEYCGKKYKNKQGLNYHLQHVHQDEIDADDEYMPSGRLTPSSIMSDDHHSTSSRASALNAQKAVAAAVAEISEVEPAETRSKRKQAIQSNLYCDFCLGGPEENKKTGEPEELISCADCVRSGHPSCLQFTDIMTMNVKKYNWQCIECKSCHLCGTSDNDDQLLFCDDCDRGYHMYCLVPPMEQPPEGSWICNLCENDRKEREKQAETNTENNSQTINL